MKPHQVNYEEAGVYDTRNPLNDLTGKQWLFSTKSVIPMTFQTEQKTNCKYYKKLLIPDKLASMLIQTFTKTNETIFDPFANRGSFLLGSSQAIDQHLEQKDNNHRNAIGIFQDKNDSQIYKEDCLKRGLTLQKSYLVDLNKWLDENINKKKEFFSFIATEIPIWNEHQEYTNFYGMNKKKFALNPLDEISIWQKNLTNIFSNIIPLLKNKRYLVIAVSIDIFEEFLSNESVPKSFDLSMIVKDAIISAGIVLKSEIIWFEPNNSKNNFIPARKKILVFKRED